MLNAGKNRGRERTFTWDSGCKQGLILECIGSRNQLLQAREWDGTESCDKGVDEML